MEIPQRSAGAFKIDQGFPLGMHYPSAGAFKTARGFPSGMHYPSAGAFKIVRGFPCECTIPRLGRSKSPGLVKIQTWLILQVVVCTAAPNCSTAASQFSNTKELLYYIPGSAHAAQTTTGRINQVGILTSPGYFERPSRGIVHSP